MKTYTEIEGDLIKLAQTGNFDVIAHGCTCLSTQKAGLAPQMVKAFGTDKFKMEVEGKGIYKLGCIDYETFQQEKEEFGGKWVRYPDEENFLTGKQLTVCNAYTQYSYGRNHLDGVSKPLDYEALTLCMRKMNYTFKGQTIGLPAIGCGLAGGDFNIVREIIKKELKDCNIIIVIYKP